MLRLLDEAEAEGIDISFDQTPYGRQYDDERHPAAMGLEGGTDCVLRRLSDQTMRQKMIADIQKGIPGWDDFIVFAGLDRLCFPASGVKKSRMCRRPQSHRTGTETGKRPV